MVDTHYCSSDSHYVVAGNRTQDSSFSRRKLKVSRGARAIDSRMLHRCSMKHVSVSAERARRPLNPAASAAKPPAPAAQESGLAAFTSVAAPADRKAIRLPQHLFKLYAGLKITEWPWESVCVMSTLIDHRVLPCSTSCKHPLAHFRVPSCHPMYTRFREQELAAIAAIRPPIVLRA